MNILLQIAHQYVHFLGGIRDWQNLTVAKADDSYWVRGFTEAQLERLELRSIPYMQLFEKKGDLLFPMGEALPNTSYPEFHWIPIDQAITVELPTFNHNYFGQEEEVMVRIVPSDKQEEECLLLTTWEDLRACVSTLPAIRMEGLEWMVLDRENVMIFGSPVLPVRGKTYWMCGRSILPVGYQFEYPGLLHQVAIKAEIGASEWLFWQEDQSCSIIQRDHLRPLSRSSVRLSEKMLTSQRSNK